MRYLSPLLLAMALLPTSLVSLADDAAAAVCGEREAMTQQLAEQYQERSESMGLTSDGNLLEVYLSEQGTFTVLLVSPKWVACVVAAGEAWEQKDPLAPRPKRDAQRAAGTQR